VDVVPKATKGALGRTFRAPSHSLQLRSQLQGAHESMQGMEVEAGPETLLGPPKVHNGVDLHV
jgi:hypothetical protein